MKYRDSLFSAVLFNCIYVLVLSTLSFQNEGIYHSLGIAFFSLFVEVHVLYQPSCDKFLELSSNFKSMAAKILLLQS
jgi:hypothetical protein